MLPQAHRGYETSTEHKRRLKKENALEWTGQLNNIRVCAREIVNEEIVENLSFIRYNKGIN